MKNKTAILSPCEGGKGRDRGQTGNMATAATRAADKFYEHCLICTPCWKTHVQPEKGLRSKMCDTGRELFDNHTKLLRECFQIESEKLLKRRPVVATIA